MLQQKSRGADANQPREVAEIHSFERKNQNLPGLDEIKSARRNLPDGLYLHGAQGATGTARLTAV